MDLVSWHGSPAPREVARALRDSRIQVGRADDSDTSLPAVVFTATGRPPRAREPTRPWIWLSGAHVAQAGRMEAVMRGAYAVVSLQAPRAVDELIVRLRELLLHEPPPEAPAHIVAESDASRQVVAQVARVAPTSMPVLITGET